MATSTNVRAIAATLFESLIGTASDQLKAAAPKLAQVSGSGEKLQQQILAALPAEMLPQVRNFVLGLAKEGLLDQFEAVAEAFAGFAGGMSIRPIDALVTSAVALDAAQQEKIAADLRKRYGPELAVTFAVDASLIGGLIIRVGDQVLDNSLRTRLGAIQRSMLAS